MTTELARSNELRSLDIRILRKEHTLLEHHIPTIIKSTKRHHTGQYTDYEMISNYAI